MQQVVDPFAPVTVMPRLGRPARRIIPRATPTFIQRRPIDGLMVTRPHRHAYSASRQAQSGPRTPITYTSAPQSRLFQAQFTPPAASATVIPASPSRDTSVPKAKSSRLSDITQVLLVVFGSIGIGFLLQAVVLGEVAIGLYAVYVILRRVDSRVTFTLALFSLAAMAGLLVVRPDDKQVPANLAVYTFLLLAVGTISLSREMRAQNRN